jgi:hypothetical protein
MVRSPRKVSNNYSNNWPFMGKLLPLLILCLMVSCGREGPDEKVIEVSFAETGVESSAVLEILPLVFPSHLPEKKHLAPAHQSLFTYLAKTEPADLVTTDPHSQGKWRIEKIFILDDCVAVQMTEGHYLETLFFVQYTEGWRLKSRITPEDHK